MVYYETARDAVCKRATRNIYIYIFFHFDLKFGPEILLCSLSIQVSTILFQTVYTSTHRLMTNTPQTPLHFLLYVYIYSVAFTELNWVPYPLTTEDNIPNNLPETNRVKEKESTRLTLAMVTSQNNEYRINNRLLFFYLLLIYTHLHMARLKLLYMSLGRGSRLT